MTEETRKEEKIEKAQEQTEQIETQPNCRARTSKRCPLAMLVT